MMKKAIIMLYMTGEQNDTHDAIKRIEHHLNENTKLFLLGNAVPEADAITASNFVHSYVHSENLGVAGGRNYLIKKSQEEFSPDLFINLDNDIVIPESYFTTLEQIYHESQEKLGVLSPLVLQKPLIHLKIERCIQFINNGEIFDYLKDAYYGNRDIIYHAGTSEWKRHYLANPVGERIKRKLIRYAKKLKLISNKTFPEFTFNASKKDFIGKIFQDPEKEYHVDTLPGGLQIYSQNLLEQIGPYDERFRPFGYEDADLCIRAIRGGYKNFLIPKLVVLHDLQERNVSREYKEVLKHFARTKKILIEKFTDGFEQKSLYYSYMIFYPIVILRNAFKKGIDNKFELVKLFWSKFQ